MESMSERGTFDGQGEFASFDIISQSCDVEMDVESRMSTARVTAREILGDNATDEDAMLFLNDIDDSWLAATLVDDPDLNASLINDPTVNESPSIQSDAICVNFGDVKVEMPGFRELPHPVLVNAGKGQEKMKSWKNNNWALRRVDKLRSALGWDMKVTFGDLSLTKVDELLANLFSRVIKIKGGEYPAESLMNMPGSYNRILRRASDIRSLKDSKSIPFGKDFCIKKHPAFVRTRLTLDAAIKKTAKDGTNKKRKKVNHITEAMEHAVLVDVDHQIFHNEGCQKRIAFYLLVRCGIRGGDELWQLRYFDLVVKTDKHGREYVQYMERESKNNCYTLDRTKEEQFRKPYHSYEPDFIATAKQYLRHLPPWVEGNKDSLLLGCIKRPTSIVWYKKAFKVGKGTSSNWLKNMLKLVGLPENLFSNKSGRATLITRLAAGGVPDTVGIMLSGHHTTNGYGRYDRTKDLQQEAAAMVAYNPRMSYEMALAEVSKTFVEKDLKGCSENLKPLIYPISGASSNNPMMSGVLEASSSHQFVPSVAHVQTEASSSSTALQLQAGRILQNLQNQVPKQIQVHPETETVKVHDHPNKLAIWNDDYDGIDWDIAIKHDPKLANALGGLAKAGSVAIGTGNSFSNCQNCTIHINLPPSFNPTSFDFAKMLEFNKENQKP